MFWLKKGECCTQPYVFFSHTFISWFSRFSVVAGKTKFLYFPPQTFLHVEKATIYLCQREIYAKRRYCHWLKVVFLRFPFGSRCEDKSRHTDLSFLFSWSSEEHMPQEKCLFPHLYFQSLREWYKFVQTAYCSSRSIHEKYLDVLQAFSVFLATEQYETFYWRVLAYKKTASVIHSLARTISLRVFGFFCFLERHFCACVVLFKVLDDGVSDIKS